MRCDNHDPSRNVIRIAGWGAAFATLSLLAAAPVPAAVPASDVVAVHALAAAGAMVISGGAKAIALAAKDQAPAAPSGNAKPPRDTSEPASIWDAKMVRGCVQVGNRVSC